MAELRLDGLRTALLAPLDLGIASGELVFLSGPSGSGKSRLLRAIADLDPHGGEVWIDGVARSQLCPTDWRRRVGLLPAESAWWAESVGEHFPAATDDRAIQILHAALDHVGFAPDVLGWAIERLSTGERQRLALIRLLVRGPEVLLLDEATANLDPVNRDSVEALIYDYRRQQAAAVFWVSHDPEQRDRLGTRSLVICDRRLEPES